MAQAPVSSETSFGITETAWYRAPAASGCAEGSAVFDRSEGGSELRRLFHFRSCLRGAVQSIQSLLRLEPGWDSYDARAISPRAVGTALAFLFQSAAYPRPSIVPTSKGGIQLEWHIGLIDVEIECMPTGHAQLSGDDADSGESVERWVAPGHIAIDAWLAKLPTRTERTER